jgi:hypothetical protein
MIRMKYQTALMGIGRNHEEEAAEITTQDSNVRKVSPDTGSTERSEVALYDRESAGRAI